MGLATFATRSDGQAIENPRLFRREERALARAQRQHQRALDAHTARRASVTARVKQTHPELDEAGVWQEVSQDAEERVAWTHRQQRCRVVARTHERARWKREDVAHQHRRRMVNAFDLIAVEDLSVTSMVQDGRFIAVNPAHTSQDCSGCGHRKEELTLAERVDRCVCCGLVIDRDLNASQHILAVGRHCLGLAP